MGISTVIAAVGVGVAAAGTVMQYSASRSAAQANQAALADQQRAERLRQQQMQLDALRRRREVVRQAIAARSFALNQTTNQGASSAMGGGSALPGAYGSISGRSNVNALGIAQNLSIGQGIFQANQSLLSDYSQVAQAQGQNALGQGVSSLGGALIRNNDVIARVGTFVASKLP